MIVTNDHYNAGDAPYDVENYRCSSRRCRTIDAWALVIQYMTDIASFEERSTYL